MPWLCLTATVFSGHSSPHSTLPGFLVICPPGLDPAPDGLPAATEIFSGDEAILRQVARLQALVRIPSFSYDDTEPENDPRWQVFNQIHDALQVLYPNVSLESPGGLVVLLLLLLLQLLLLLSISPRTQLSIARHTRMTRNTVNSFGLVYAVQGTNASLRPFMLTGHQDVVLVPDPPFSGHCDGHRVWGRGASDDKNIVTAILSVLEHLLSNPSWKPKRTIIVALGFDEESSRRRGAGTISKYLQDKYGPQSMAMILDEAGLGLQLLQGNTLYALPSVMEKGHVNICIDLTARGGHSSAPAQHTGIGIMAELVAAIETNVLPKRKIINVATPIAAKYNLTLHAFRNGSEESDSNIDGHGFTERMIVTSDQETEVSHVSPTSGRVWDLFSGTIQHTFAFENGLVVPVGESMTGNTDTRHYLNLATNVYRWAPTRQGWSQNIHAVDEAIEMRAHMEGVCFYYNLIRNLDASDV
ncbi:hypothetical protein S40288_05142 [Stachybotrys chartarum IBT 40288]|nr:hypothetical protein S40288_05142 [Stachybotrys chartarum IBT 40288]